MKVPTGAFVARRNGKVFVTGNSGFPKAHDLSKAIDRAAGVEREVVGSTPRPKFLKGRGHGRNPDGTPVYLGVNGGHDGQIEHQFTAPATDLARQWAGWAYGLQSLKPALEPICLAQKPFAEVTSDEIHALTGWDHWCSSRSDGEDKIVTARSLRPEVRSYRARLGKDGRELAREDLGEYAPFVLDGGTANVLRHGTGALNIDAGRIPAAEIVGWNGNARRKPMDGDPRRGASLGLYEPGERDEARAANSRWPANLALSGDEEVREAFALFQSNGTRDIVNPSRGIDEMVRECEQLYMTKCAHTAGTASECSIRDALTVLTHAVTLASHGGIALSGCQGLGESVTASNLMLLCRRVVETTLSISGKPAQEQQPASLFQSNGHAKAAVETELTGITTITISHWKSDGSADPVICSIMPERQEPGDRGSGAKGTRAGGFANIGAPKGDGIHDGSPARFFKECRFSKEELRFHFGPKAASWERQGGHPTVKPVELMLWLTRLVCPPSGRLLDPFCGTGSTLVACDWLGFDAVGIEQDEQTCRDAEAKIKRLRARRLLGDAPRHEPMPGQLGLF